MIVGEFSCRGYDRTGPWVVMDGYNKSRPNERDIFKAKLFAEKIKCELHPLATIYKVPVNEYFSGIAIRKKDTEIIAGNKVVFLNTSTCISCGRCIKICPMHIFTLRDKVLPMNEDNCIQCRLCADKCPSSSIFIKESSLNGLRIAFKESFSDELQKSYNSNDMER